jgi:hypothetical protein
MPAEADSASRGALQQLLVPVHDILLCAMTVQTTLHVGGHVRSHWSLLVHIQR